MVKIKIRLYQVSGAIPGFHRNGFDTGFALLNPAPLRSSTQAAVPFPPGLAKKGAPKTNPL